MPVACKTRKKIFLVILLLCNMTSYLCAQNNPYKINDKLYPLFIKAFNLRTSDKCLPVIDSLQHQSIAIGDRYGELNALVVRLTHEYHKDNNLPALEQAANELMEKSERYNLMRFYYHAISLKITYLSKQHKYIEALLYLEEQTRLAEKRNDKEGICSLHRMLAVILQFRGELSEAVSCYQQVIDEYKKYNVERYISREYLSISDCYRMMTDYLKMEEAAEEALPYCVNQNDRNNVFIYQAYACFMLKKYDEFIDRYQYLQEHKLRLDNTYIIMNEALKVLKAIYDGRNDDAIEAIEKMAKRSEVESYRLYDAYYSYNNDIKKSIEYIRKLMRARNNGNEEIFRYDKKSTDILFKNQKMIAEKQSIINKNTRLELSNANMVLRNSSLELGRIRDTMFLAQATEKRNELYGNNQKLVAQQLRDSLTTQKLLLQAKEHKYKTELFLYAALIIMVAASIILTLIFSLRKRTLAKRLSSTNNRLKESISLLDAAKEKAMESEKMKTMFVQNMSHEIRTPLNAIVGFSHVLTDMGDDFNTEEKENMAKHITDSSELLTTLINDILDMTHIQSGSMTIRKTELNINEVCKECIATVKHRLTDKVEIIFNTDADDSFCIVSDRHRISEVLINILTNADKNTSEGSITVDCSVKEKPGMVTITVTDTGVGISKDKHKEIFKRYQKLNTMKQGSGLGLDICRTIVNKLGGEIDIDPEYTNGARFWFTIPTGQ